MYEAYVTALADMFYPSAASAASGDPAPYSAACVSRAFHGWEAPSAGVAGCPPRSRPSCARSARTWISASRARGRRFATRAWGRDRARAQVPRLQEGGRQARRAVGAPGSWGDGRFDAMVPVPLHRSRLRKRGFNRATLLARGVAEGINATVSDTLKVVRSKRDQVELSAAQRRANVAGAYRASAPLRGIILLIDDVFTPGATMSACATTLLRAGAQEVHALSLCRTV